MFNELIIVGLIQGLLLGLIAYGIMIPFRLLDFADMTSEGTYPLGGIICAFLLINNIDPVTATILATILAGIVGIMTALVYLKFRINSLLAGIIVCTMLYSVSLRIMGKPNIALFQQIGLFDNLDNITIIMILLFLSLGLAGLLYLFLKTEVGLRFRTIGLNLEFAKRQNISINFYTILGLFIANCYYGVAGSLLVQIQLYADIGMGVGIVIHGLAALMIGECLVGNQTLKKQLLAPFIGGLVYSQVQGLVLQLGLAPSDMKFVTGAIVLMVIAMRKHRGYAGI